MKVRMVVVAIPARMVVQILIALPRMRKRVALTKPRNVLLLGGCLTLRVRIESASREMRVRANLKIRRKGIASKRSGRKGSGRKASGRKGIGRKGIWRKGIGRKGIGRKGIGSKRWPEAAGIVAVAVVVVAVVVVAVVLVVLAVVPVAAERRNIDKCSEEKNRRLRSVQEVEQRTGGVIERKKCRKEKHRTRIKIWTYNNSCRMIRARGMNGKARVGKRKEGSVDLLVSTDSKTDSKMSFLIPFHLYRFHILKYLTKKNIFTLRGYTMLQDYFD
jgi:hypothetical protein